MALVFNSHSSIKSTCTNTEFIQSCKIKENSTEDVEVRSIDVGLDVGRNEHLEHALQEHYVLKQVNLWQGPKYTGCCSIIKCVQSFDNWDWPESKPTPVFLAEAEIFTMVC
jgi:hypothetical protein